MPDKWVLDEEYPGGHLVEMTPGEVAQLERDQEAGAALMAAQAAASALISERADALRQARSDLALGAIFAELSKQERKVIDLLLAERSPDG